MIASRWATAALLCAAVAFVGCPKRIESPTAVLEEAAKSAQGKADARTLALAGFQSLLVEGDTAQAQARFDAAVKKDPYEPWALYGQLQLARRAGHIEQAMEAAFQLTEHASAHPLSATAARYILDQIGTSTALDDRIIDSANRALAQHPIGDTAHLLRSAEAIIAGQRIDAAAQDQALAKMGVVTEWTLLGPFSPYHVLSFDEVTPPEASGAMDGSMTGPFGPLKPRLMHFPDGRLALSGEPSDGDMYVLASDFQLEDGGDYVVRSVTYAPHKVYVDGKLVFQRRSFERAESTVSSAGVHLDAGKHRILVKLSNDDGNAGVTVSVLRADGQPSQHRYLAAQGAAPSWSGVKTYEPRATWDDPESYAKTLERDVGPALAEFVSIYDGMGRDPNGAERLMDALAEQVPATPALLSLRADLALSDRSLPSRVSKARATRDLEAALDKDKTNVHALLTRASLALDDGRQAEAAELVKRARAAVTPVGFQVPMVRARVDLAMGVDAQADRSAQEALGLQPGLCEALALRYDLARRRDAVTAADELVKSLDGCPGSRTRLAEHARTRGRIDEAIQLYNGLLERDPTNLNAVQTLANLYVSRQRYADAVKLLQQTRAIWPRNPDLSRKLADVYDFWGKPKEALAAREQALKWAGGDLALQRAVHRTKTGKELLAEYAIDGREAIRRYEAQPTGDGAASAMVLDFAAVQVFEDGSSVDRTHVVQKALAQEGVSDIGEVNIPPGAALLTLRTIKQDGTVLEPENIEGKEAVSLPGVQVGDYIEYEYLQAHAARGPALPGFSAPIFYYQVAGVPNAWSTYVVVAPKELGMTVDAHNVKSAPPAIEGDQSVYRHEETHVPPYIPEPNAPPSPNEYLPWVQLGAGAHGNDGLVALYADAFLDRGRITHTVESFAKKAAEGKTGIEAIKAIDAAVMQTLQGRDAGLTVSAASSLAQDRGSRLWALKSALETQGIKTRVALVRTFFADPAPYTFPNENLLPYICLRAELPGGQVVWLDTAIRFGPFGQLPEAAADRDAYLLPEPGRPLEKVHTPAGEPYAGKAVTLALQLGQDGTLTGTGEERYLGFDAAQLTGYLEQLPPDQRKQAMQSALSRYFGGAEMEKLDLTLANQVGGELVVRYQFRVPGFARVEGNSLVMQPVTFPAQLGRRFVQLGSRTTPLFIDSTERTVTHATLKLPPGYMLNDPVGEARLPSPFGSYLRQEQQAGDTVQINEEYLLKMARIPPSQYDAFGRFAGQVDLLQGRDLVVQKK